MKKINLYLSLFITILISSFCVCASDDAPPAIPAVYWGTVIMDGTSASDGLAVTAEVSSVNYAQPFQTLNGYYSIILVNGDRELTYNDDKDCSTHWAASEACVPCVDEADCIEGPEDGADIMVKVDGIGDMPHIDWVKGASEEISIVNPIGDWDEGGCVDMVDFTYFANHYGEVCDQLSYDLCDFYDVYRDYVIDMVDFTVFANHYNEGACS